MRARWNAATGATRKYEFQAKTACVVAILVPGADLAGHPIGRGSATDPMYRLPVDGHHEARHATTFHVEQNRCSGGSHGPMFHVEPTPAVRQPGDVLSQGRHDQLHG